MRALPTADQIADKQIRNVSGAVQAYKDGIARVTVAPGQLAAAKKDKWLQAIQDSANKWATNVAKVSLQQWATAASTTGAQRLGQGITAARPKLVAFWQRFLPYLAQTQQQISAMPSDTFEQRMARMDANARSLHNFSNQ